MENLKKLKNRVIGVKIINIIGKYYLILTGIHFNILKLSFLKIYRSKKLLFYNMVIMLKKNNNKGYKSTFYILFNKMSAFILNNKITMFIIKYKLIIFISCIIFVNILSISFLYYFMPWYMARCALINAQDISATVVDPAINFITEENKAIKGYTEQAIKIYKDIAVTLYNYIPPTKDIIMWYMANHVHQTLPLSDIGKDIFKFMALVGKSIIVMHDALGRPIYIIDPDALSLMARINRLSVTQVLIQLQSLDPSGYGAVQFSHQAAEAVVKVTQDIVNDYTWAPPPYYAIAIVGGSALVIAGSIIINHLF